MVTVGSIAPLTGETVNPQQRRAELFAHYSIPAYDDGAGPVLEAGESIRSNKTAFPRGAVLFSKLNPRISRVWHVFDEQSAVRVCSTEFLPLLPDPARCDARYLAWMMRSSPFQSSIAGPSAATKSRERVKPADVTSARVPLPPLFRQRQIADRLDTAMMDIASTSAALHRQRADTTALKAEAVTQALGGRVVAAASDLVASEDGWVHLTHVARLESGHTPSRRHPEWWGGDVPWIALPDIRALDGTTAMGTTERINALGLANSSARLLPPGTVVLSRTASVGFVTVMGVPMATSQDFVNWVPGDRLRPWYLARALIAARDYVRGLAEGAIHKTIYMPTLRELRIRLPSLEEQDRVLAKIEALLGAAAEAEVALSRQAAALDALGPAILAAAFRGEL